jgi:3-methyladenine DNA glycosylase AlkC
MSENEEVKTVGEVKCPQCQALITIKKRIRYNQPDRRRKTDEELYAEPSVQTTLPEAEKRGKKKASAEE